MYLYKHTTTHRPTTDNIAPKQKRKITLERFRNYYVLTIKK